jgi:hypothetical protein
VPTFDINQTRATLASTNWDRRRDVTTAHRHRVYTHDCLPLGHFYVDHDKDLIVTGPDSFQALAIDLGVWMAVIARLAEGDNGLLFINLHAGQFAELLRARAAEAGVANVIPHDTIYALQERTQWLMVTAQSLRKAASAAELDLFVAERTKLNTEVRHVAEGVRRLEVMLELATDMVFAA